MKETFALGKQTRVRDEGRTGRCAQAVQGPTRRAEEQAARESAPRIRREAARAAHGARHHFGQEAAHEQADLPRDRR